MKIAISTWLAMMAILASAQDPAGKQPDQDPFLSFIIKMKDIQSFSYHATNRQKALFSYDTLVTQAEVTVGKTGDSITYLHIVEKNSSEELVFYQDTGWFLPRERNLWKIAGIGLEQVKHASLFYFLPLNLFTIRPGNAVTDPFWNVRSETGGMFDIQIEIREKPREISDMAVHIRIGEADGLLYGSRQVARFDAYDDAYFQELIFEGYQFPEKNRLDLPASFLSIPREDNAGITSAQEEEPEETEADFYLLPDTGLTFPDGRLFILPDSGLLFFDLWYVGCFPCMKSAPVIEEIHGEYKDRLRFYSINEIDTDTARIQRYVSKMGLTFPVLLNGGPKLSVQVSGSNAYPVFFIIDASNRSLLWHHAGFSEDMEDVIRQALEEIL